MKNNIKGNFNSLALIVHMGTVVYIYCGGLVMVDWWVGWGIGDGELGV